MIKNLGRKFRSFVQWSLAGLIGLQILTGYGISQYKAVEWLTFGLLTKTLSFKLHSTLGLPVIVFVLLHIYLGMRWRWFGGDKNINKINSI